MSTTSTTSTASTIILSTSISSSIDTSITTTIYSTPFLSEWGDWYTTKCILNKTRRNKFNASQIECVSIHITFLNGCDRININFTSKVIISNAVKTKSEIAKLNITLNQQITNLEKTQAKLKIASTCLSWLAITTVVFIFSLALINDLVKLFFLFKENDYIKHDKDSNAKKSELYK
jgi:hypothetical protein